MGTKNKKKDKQKPRKHKIDLMAGMSRPKPISFQSTSQFLQQTREYPTLGCWIMNGWKDQGLTPVVVARQQPEDKVVYGVFLVDIFCLGVKDAFWRTDISLKHFDRDLPRLCSNMPEPCEINLAHDLIYGSIEYARQYGFEPHPDFGKASLVLDPPEMHPQNDKLEFGKDGKPLFIAGPYDNAQAILNQLMRTAGEGNFNYLVRLDSPDNY
jgi:hypothetical protein